MTPTTDLRPLRVSLSDPPALPILLRPPRPSTPAAPRLTPRQLQVLELVAEGLENKAIAERLGIAVSTVGNAIAALMEAFEAGNRTGMAVKAVRMGIV